jgi:CheY-like chemotaxis protein
VEKVDKHLLVIDDDEIQHFLLKRIFFQLRPDLAVVSARTAEEGLALLNEQTGAILLDLHMPGMTGWELLDFWNRQKITLPPLFIFSSSPDPSDVLMAQENPQVSGYLLKPLEEEKIQTLILSLFQEG